MNIYVIVEGQRAAKRIYKIWIPLVNRELKFVDYVKDINYNNFFILAGHGQPGIKSRIESAINDVNNNSLIDRLVISMDSENATYQDKYDEIHESVGKYECRVEIRYIIQHFCMETWLMGNKDMFRKKPQDITLNNFMKLYNIRQKDPEMLPCYPKNSWNRAQFAFYFLQAGIRDKHTYGLSYTKKNPGITATPGYFLQVNERYMKSHHISSFSDFIEAFSN
jgi:hypothetical protein